MKDSVPSAVDQSSCSSNVVEWYDQLSMLDGRMLMLMNVGAGSFARSN
jgi:hypothetical protein